MSILLADLNAKVREIIDRYHPIQILHPVVSEMYDAPEFERMFWDCLVHDLQVIRRRSQSLADGEITVAQKAFRILMDENNGGIAAIELYVNEIIGLEIVPETDRAQALATALQTRDYILNESRGGKNSIATAITAQDETILPVSDSYCTQSSENDLGFERPQQNEKGGLFVSDGSETSRSSDVDGTTIERGRKRALNNTFGSPSRKPNASFRKKMLMRLFITYQKAKKDFEATPLKSLERTKSAKFLRDTIENCLAYLAARQDPSLGREFFDATIQLSGGKATIDAMKSTLQEAIEAAEEGSGGKKRRFDEDWTAVPEAPATMRPLIVKRLTSRDPVPRGTRLNYHRWKSSVPSRTQKQRPSNVRNYGHSIAQSEQVPHGLYPASSGQDKRRVFPMPSQDHKKYTPKRQLEYGDCYRPKYS